jgi:hypothetical protein
MDLNQNQIQILNTVLMYFFDFLGLKTDDSSIFQNLDTFFQQVKDANNLK